MDLRSRMSRESALAAHRASGFVLLSALLLAGCGTPPAKDFHGHWSSVNRFQADTTEIPLNRTYTYYASPMDETLKNMLQRWVTDTGMTLVYRLPSDYTLFSPVAKVRTPDIRQAAAQLTAIYAAQGVSIAVEGERLQVERSGAIGSRSAPLDQRDAPQRSQSAPTGQSPARGAR